MDFQSIVVYLIVGLVTVEINITSVSQIISIAFTKVFFKEISDEEVKS
jgi:hypothetical protein